MEVHPEAALAALLHSKNDSEREQAWEHLVEAHSRLMLHAIRQLGGEHDDVMDCYAFVLEQLRADDFRRLRTWKKDGRSRLSTWLVVVVRRLCTDHRRKRYGRIRAAGVQADEARMARRMLVDMIAEELREDTAAPVHADDGEDPELQLRASELRQVLAAAVGELAPADRLILALRFRDDLSAARIARVVGLPSPFHVYRRLEHLLGVLRRALSASGIEDSVP